MTACIVIKNEILCKALEESYSTGNMDFPKQKSKGPYRAQQIHAPVEYKGNFYICFSGSWGLSDGEHGESIEQFTCCGHRLFTPEEYEGEIRTHLPGKTGGVGYTGMLVIDPQGKEWVCGEEEIAATYQKINYPEQPVLF